MTEITNSDSYNRQSGDGPDTGTLLTHTDDSHTTQRNKRGKGSDSAGSTRAVHEAEAATSRHPQRATIPVERARASVLQQRSSLPRARCPVSLLSSSLYSLSSLTGIRTIPSNKCVRLSSYIHRFACKVSSHAFIRVRAGLRAFSLIAPMAGFLHDIV